jgi:hypothetical protein
LGNGLRNGASSIVLNKTLDKKRSNESVDTSFAPNGTTFEISNYKISAYQFHTTY